MVPPESRRVRLDVWLDVACLFKTRSEARRACASGKVAVDGARAKPHRLLRVGDRIDISRPLGRLQQIVVRGLSDSHVPRAEAKTLYDDVTPPPSPEETEIRRIDRLARMMERAAGAPDKRARRRLRELKGRQ